ncbi:IgGFc-binding protein [Sorangium sp. So ce426]|uniref:IgGFc-binding protein n=1 Tax=Sorangium sp. So ce426 TaxID=3133312 RepID=UPI003F5C64F1
MANMARYRRHAIVGLLAATAGVTGSFAACTDSYRHGLTGSGSGPTGTGGSGNGSGSGTGGAGGEAGSTGTFGEGGRCEYTCSNDLKKVISCNGATIEECKPEEGCLNAQCVPDPCTAARESKSSYGCDYWALKTALRPTTQGACFAAIVANTWNLPVHINVERDGEQLPVNTFAYIPEWNEQTKSVSYTKYADTNELAAGQVAVLFLSRLSAGGGIEDCPAPGALDEETGVPEFPGEPITGRGKAFHITTDFPVVAYQILPYGGGKASFTSATLLLPTSAWDSNYVAINGYSESESQSPAYNGAYPSLAIVAHEDDTAVTILPKVNVEAGDGVESASAGEAKTYTLNAGEFLQITQRAELTGSPIQSTKPVGLFGAHACMLVPAGSDVRDCDSGQQQIAPVRATGSEYVAVRHRNRTEQDESPPYRIVGMVDGTRLTWEPSRPENAPEELRLGEVYEFATGEPFIVKSQDANHPFYVGQYMTGGSLFGGIGDPEWVNVIPPSQYLDYYAFFTDPTYPETSLVVVRTRSRVNGEFADVELDCVGKLTGWTPVGDGSYEYTVVDLMTGEWQSVNGCVNGRHEMRSELPFGVTVWGWGAIQQNYRVSYAYPAGAGFLPINNVEIPPVAN